VTPKISEAEKTKVRDKLMSLKKKVESGSSFLTKKAVLYSKDQDLLLMEDFIK
jgi:hypothetical protein